MFKLWLLWTESRGDKLSCLQIDRGRKFINIALKDFYNEKRIDIGYAAFYKYEENSIAK